jgi:GT2 family glycosyltransferase/SAM-dependent methyltransferase
MQTLMASRVSAEPGTVAVVILTWSQAEITLRCLDSLVRSGIPAETVVLWDNGSSDGTADAVAEAYPRVVFHRSQRNLGVASGRNAAAELAMRTLGPDYLLFLDNDMVVTEGLIDRLRAPFQDDPMLAQTEAKIRMLGDSRRINAAGGSHVAFHRGTTTPVGYGELDEGQFDTPRVCLPNGGATMVRTDVFRQLHGFDPVFDPYGPEDLDFSFRVRKAGYHGLYVPDAMVYHRHDRTVEGGDFTRTYTANKVRHWLVLMRRHASLWQQVRFFVWGAPSAAFRLLRRELTRGNLAVVTGMLGGLRTEAGRRADPERRSATAMRGKLMDLLRDLRRSVVRRTRLPPVGGVDLGSLDRLTPVSRDWGFDRGAPVDRGYIERFLSDNAGDIRGRVLEVADNEYTGRFGGSAVAESHILHDAPGHPRATLVADLSRPDRLPDERFDCIICTQTLHLIYDVRAAIQSLRTLLRPGGVLLLTAPAITPISREDMRRHGDFWRFTSAALRRLMTEQFGAGDVNLVCYGNVYAATAFLQGLAVEELDQHKLDYFDEDYEMLIGIRAVAGGP